MRRAAASLIVVAALLTSHAQAAETAAIYDAYWAGIAAGRIRLSLHDAATAYRADIAIRTKGLARLVTRFQGTATTEGALAHERPVPARYGARYDLRKRQDRHLSMQFTREADGLVAERGPDDTSKKPPLPVVFRTNVLDPLSALTAIRGELRRGNRGAFSVPVYDGARRFDAQVQVEPSRAGDPALRLSLTLVPIAGFKGETSDDGDPDNSPRPVALTLSNDARFLPIGMTVPLYFMPLVVQLDHTCDTSEACGW